ncbi:MAG: hypothetical protein ACHQ3P_07940 [Candidatus Limnocylindrales bacterium]
MASTEAPLDSAYRRPCETDSIAEFGLGSAAPGTGVPHVCTEARELLAVAPGGFRPDLLALELDHVRCMVVPGSCPPLAGLEVVPRTDAPDLRPHDERGKPLEWFPYELDAA